MNDKQIEERFADETLLFQWTKPDDWPTFSDHDDMADEYRVFSRKAANDGLVVYSKYGNTWTANCGERALIRHLLERLGIGTRPKQTAPPEPTDRITSHSSTVQHLLDEFINPSEEAKERFRRGYGDLEKETQQTAPPAADGQH